MRQVVNITAVNFGDLLKLKKAVNDILASLRYIENKPDFLGASVTLECVPPTGVIVKIVSLGCDEHQTPQIPEGVAPADWAELIGTELSNLLFCGGYFTVKKTCINETMFKYEVK